MHLRAVAAPDDVESAAQLVSPTAPELPDSLPPELRPMWDRIVGTLDDAGLIAACDGPVLELALRHYAAAVRASDELAAASSVAVEDPVQGRLAKHPADQTFRGQSAQFLEFAKVLGLSFVARARVNTQGRAGDDGGSNPFASTGS